MVLNQSIASSVSTRVLNLVRSRSGSIFNINVGKSYYLVLGVDVSTIFLHVDFDDHGLSVVDCGEIPHP